MTALKSILVLLGKWLLLIVMVIAMVFLALIVYTFIAAARGQPADEILQLGSSNLTLAIIQDLAIIAGVWLMYISFERKSGLNLGWRQARAGLRLSEGLVVGILLITLAGLLIWLLGGVRVQAGVFDRATWQSLISGILLFAIVAVAEELLSRGYVQGQLRQKYGVRVAVVVSSLLFSALHLANPDVIQSPWPIINLVLAGVLFGVAREVSGGLWMPIGFHLTWNFFQGHIYGFEVSGEKVHSVLLLTRQGNQAVSGGAFGAEGSVVTTIVLLAGIFAIYRYYRRSVRTRAGSL